jgi:DNA-binding transcriptional MerR regulator
MMTSGEVADMLGVKAQTIRNWVNNPILNEFFSAAAKDKARTRADFSQRDLYILNTIHVMSRRGTGWNVIAEQIRADALETALPDRAAIVGNVETTVQTAARMTATAIERDSALAQVANLQKQLLGAFERVAEIEREKSELKEKLLREIADLREKIGYLTGKLDNK